MTFTRRFNLYIGCRKRKIKRTRKRVHCLGESFTNLTKVSLIMANHLFSKQEFKENNIVFSPLSLYTALSIIAAGSEGSTRHQLLSFLRSKSTKHLNSFASHLINVTTSSADGPRLSFTNGVWVEQTLSLQPSFNEVVSTDYKATLASVDFKTKAIEVTKEVNLWIEKETNGLIKKILPPCSVNNLTRIIFTNALYFKGKWDYPFEAWKTRNYDFHLLNGNSVKVPFMTSNDDQFISALDDFKVLRLPYKQGEDKRQFSIYIFLPNARDGLAALVDKVASKSELLHHKLPFKKVKVSNLKIQKFQFLFELETSDMLKELGVILPFSPGGLTKMTDSIEESQNIYVSNIFHKSFIKVNEDGTEAVAAQASCLERECMCISSRLDFVADHPFLFLIREDSTQTILFMGQVLNPLVR